jgi:AraC-like DNA-binding protein
MQQGEVTITFSDGRSATARKGEWMILPPGTRQQDFAPGSVLYSLCLMLKWPDERPFLDHGLPVRLTIPEGKALEWPLLELHSLVEREIPGRDGPRNRSITRVRIPSQVYFELNMVLSGLLRVLMDALEAKGVAPDLHPIQDVRVVKALDQLEHTPFTEMPDVSGIARSVGLSQEQLTRQFKHWVGHTPKAHLHHRKLEMAKALLASKETPLKEVAYQLGFPSPSAFSNWCNHHLGGSPRQIRQHSESMLFGP